MFSIYVLKVVDVFAHIVKCRASIADAQQSINERSTGGLDLSYSARGQRKVVGR